MVLSTVRSSGNEIQSLNIIRFFCFLLVFLMHCNLLTGIPVIDHILLQAYPRFGLGVTFFFTLSAFLLTNLAIREIGQGGFSAKNFLLRRGLRIYPLYFLFLLFVFVLLPVFSKWLTIPVLSLPKIWPYLCFLNNIFTEPAPFLLIFLWSIAAEEQFYLVFAILVPLLQKKILLFPLFLLVVYFLFVPQIAESKDFHTLHYLPYFIMGILAAILFQYYTVRVTLFLKKIPQFFFFVLAGVFLFISFYFPYLYSLSWYKKTEAFILAGIFSLLLVWACILPNRSNRMALFLNFLGKITYGLYIWHGFVLTILYTVLKSRLSNSSFLNITFLIAFPATVLLATVSYHFMEKYFLQLKLKFKKVTI